MSMVEAIRTILARCDALEDEAYEMLSTNCDTHQRGFWRGQLTTAKSLRRHLHDMTRSALAEPSGEEGV